MGYAVKLANSKAEEPIAYYGNWFFSQSNYGNTQLDDKYKYVIFGYLLCSETSNVAHASSWDWSKNLGLRNLVNLGSSYCDTWMYQDIYLYMRGRHPSLKSNFVILRYK